MHFEESGWFFDYCFNQQQTLHIDTYVAADWRYDQLEKIAECKLINSFFDSIHTVTIDCASKTAFEALQATYNQRYVSQFSNRFQSFDKPTSKLIAVYDNWQQFKSSWLVRSNQNIARISMPLLVDIRISEQRRIDLLLSLYIQPSNEIYKFGVADISQQAIDDISADLTKIVEQAYV